MDYAFTCRCGFSTNFAETAKIHLSRCILAAPPSTPKPEPMDVLAKALAEVNEIISDALKQYYELKAKRSKR